MAIDVEGSFWHLTLSPNGRWSGIDSATFPCDGYRSREWGAVEEVADNHYIASSFNVRCLQGPKTGTVFDLAGVPFIYDSVEDTILQLNVEPHRNVTFCRRPCDPYDYVP